MLLSRLKHPHFSDQYGCLILLFCLQPTQSCSIRGWVNVSRKASSTHGTLMAVHRSGDPRMKNQRKVKNILKVQPGAAQLLRDQLWKHGCKTKKACCPPQGQPSFPPSLIQYTCSEPFAHTHTHTEFLFLFRVHWEIVSLSIPLSLLWSWDIPWEHPHLWTQTTTC